MKSRSESRHSSLQRLVWRGMYCTPHGSGTPTSRRTRWRTSRGVRGSSAPGRCGSSAWSRSAGGGSSSTARAVVTSVDEQIAGRGSAAGAGADAERVPLRVEIEGEMVAPPWTQGSLDPDGQFVVGEDRIEQLFSASGSVSIDGDTISLHGGGLRIHRKGGNRSDYNDFFGHCWQSTAFPSGRAFGYIHYTPRPDGSIKYHEGWVMDGGEILPAKVVDTPWLAGTEPDGDDVGFTMRTPRGDVRIEAQTALSTFVPERSIGEGVDLPDPPAGDRPVPLGWRGGLRHDRAVDAPADAERPSQSRN